MSPHPTTTAPRITRPAAGRLFDPRRLSCRVWAAAFIAFSSAASLLYVWVLCPLGLSPDEAHYWDWSRNLDWSYYSKGPLVALLIRASCELFGPLSVALTGDLVAAVRVPAVLCHAALMAGWYVLASGVFRSPRFGLALLLAVSLVPSIRVASVLMTIDPPVLACWCWALVCVWKGLETDRAGWWAGAGACAAVGVLAKYTMVLFPAAVCGYLLFHRREQFRKPGVWLLLAGAAAGWIPVLVWNAQHDWLSFRHVFGQAGVGTSSGRIRWDGLAGFVGGQFGMMFGLWYAAFLAAAWRFRPTRESDPGIRLLWWVSVPVWSFFALASLVKPGQPNWPAPANVGGFVLAAAWVAARLGEPRTRLLRWCIGLTLGFGAVAVIMLQFPDVVRPLYARLAPEPTDDKPVPARKFDLTGRLAGWKHLAAEVDEVRAQVAAETGEDPVLVGSHWTVPGEMGVYCKGHPRFYAVGVGNGSDRYSQYDVWRPNPVADAQEYLGRTFVIVGDLLPPGQAAFERSVELRSVVYSANGVPMAKWAIWVGYGFRGFPPPGTRKY